MSDPREPVFLARESYRRRRVGDAARFVPLLALVLFLLPILWAGSNRTADTIIYVFSAWAFLIILLGFLSRRLVDAVPDKKSAIQETPAER